MSGQINSTNDIDYNEQNKKYILSQIECALDSVREYISVNSADESKQKIMVEINNINSELTNIYENFTSDMSLEYITGFLDYTNEIIFNS